MFCSSVSTMGRAVSDPPPSSRAQVRGALQQAGVDVEDVARKTFAAGRAAQQQRQLAIRARVAGQIVEHHQRVAALAHEVLAHGHGGVGRDELQTRRRVAPRDHDDRILHRVARCADRRSPWRPRNCAGRSRSRCRPRSCLSGSGCNRRRCRFCRSGGRPESARAGRVRPESARRPPWCRSARAR